MLRSPRVIRNRATRIAAVATLLAVVTAVPSLAADLSVTIVGHPAADTKSTSASFTWTRQGTYTSTQCKLDGAAYATCGNAKSYSGLSEGSHSFSVRIQGGGDSDVASFTWTVDQTGPTDPVVTGGSLTWAKPSVVLSASGSTDTGGSGVKYYQHRTSFDSGATWSASANGATHTVTTAGASITQFRAVDNAGNTSAWAPAVADQVAPLSDDVRCW